MNPISHLSQPHRKYFIPAGLTLISVALVSIAYIGYRAYIAKQTNAKIQARPQPIAAYQAKIEQEQALSKEYKELLSTTFPSLHNLGDRTSAELNTTLKLHSIKNDYTHGKLTHADLIDKLHSIQTELHADLDQEAATKAARENRLQELNAEKEKADAEKLQRQQRKKAFLLLLQKQFPSLSNLSESESVPEIKARMQLPVLKRDYVDGELTKKELTKQLQNIESALDKDLQKEAEEKAEFEKQCAKEKHEIELSYQQSQREINRAHKEAQTKIDNETFLSARNVCFDLAWDTHCDKLKSAAVLLDKKTIPLDSPLAAKILEAGKKAQALRVQFITTENPISDEQFIRELKAINDSIPSGVFGSTYHA